MRHQPAVNDHVNFQQIGKGKILNENLNTDLTGTGLITHHLLYATSTTDTLVNLEDNGNLNTFTVPAAGLVGYHVSVIGRAPSTSTPASESSWSVFSFALDRVGATTALAGGGSLTAVTSNKDNASWVIQCIADNSNDRMLVQVKGVAGQVVEWMGYVTAIHYTE